MDPDQPAHPYSLIRLNAVRFKEDPDQPAPIADGLEIHLEISINMDKTDPTIERLKTQLGLEPHPSGYGAFVQLWKGDREVKFLTETKHSGPRSSGTSIYFLLAAPYNVQWHKHMSDEGFYWHAGGKVKLHMIKDDGTHTSQVLGDVVKHEDCVAQVVVPHDTWYSAELFPGENYALYSAVVMPGFEFEDWIEGKREDLLQKFPEHKELIEKLTDPS